MTKVSIKVDFPKNAVAAVKLLTDMSSSRWGGDCMDQAIKDTSHIVTAASDRVVDATFDKDDSEPLTITLTPQQTCAMTLLMLLGKMTYNSMAGGAGLLVEEDGKPLVCRCPRGTIKPNGQCYVCGGRK